MRLFFSPRGSLATCLLVGGFALTASTAQAQLKAVPLPNPQIPGFTFPEAEATLLNWITASSQANGQDARKSIYLHGWGIWTALTSETDQVIDGQKARVFETWYGPEDLSPKTARTMADAVARPRLRTRPKALRQFRHGNRPQPNAQAATAGGVEQVAGFVKYDPSAASHIVSQGLLSVQTLNSFLANGANAIPPFERTSVSLKPAFQVLSQGSLKNGRYYPLPAWPGPPPDAVPFPSSKWNSIAWIDIQGGGGGTGAVDTTAGANPDGSTRTDATTYPVSSLINYQLNAAEAAAWNSNPPGIGNPNAAAGDYVVLLGMHVTSKEITRWTWQTFWWTPSPNVALAPSSSEIVAARPAQLTAAPRNYAMAVAYSMKSPAQPFVGGSNVGDSVYAFNPWLEAGFGPNDLPSSKPGIYQGKPVPNNVGVQTNCMSCHATATYSTAGSTGQFYTGDQYISLEDPRFPGLLTVDFLWSLPDNAQ